MAWLNARCRCEIARLRARYALGVDELHGLYTSDEQVDHLLDPQPASNGEHAAALLDAAERAVAATPLAVIGCDLQLDRDEIRALMVILAPELDLRYATVFAYLNDDLTRRHATVDLCERIAGVSPAKFDRRSRLVRLGLIDIVPRDNGPWRGAAVVARDLVRMFVLGARRSLGSDLGPLARLIDTSVSWADLSVPAATSCQLHELESAITNREMVFRDWGLDRDRNGPISLRALFAGPPGTGKTLAASVIANSVGLELYCIDLSAVVSKYIGETEKNLERLFAAAENVNAILFFDEADALFGKRSEVRDSHDRYANIEVAYLLQRMELHEGVMILATNLTNNLDEAFRRRIHFAIEFPMPDAHGRAELWRMHMPSRAPVATDIDLDFLASQFPLTGGDIHNAVLTAAFLAAHEVAPLSMNHLVRAVARQRRNQGKIPSAAEFRHHLALARRDDPA